MARNSDLLRRMYGSRAPDDPRVKLGSSGLALFWVGGLVVAFVAALVVSLGILWLGATSGVPELERWGVIAPEELILAVHDHSADRDGSAGCVVTGPRIVRWDRHEPTAEAPLPGATVEVDPAGVHVRSGDAVVDCPFAEREDPTGFAETARRWSAARRGP
jgi:hypothetical protein